MNNITASMVKELRVVSGAGMMDCKTALTESDGNMDAAVDWLRTKGLAKASKKSGRLAAEGVIVCAQAATKGVLVEVNSETDFVARNEQFQAMAHDIAVAALATDGTIDAVLATPYPGGDKNIEQHIQAMIGTIGENMSVRRAVALEVKSGIVGRYIHNQVAVNMGKIGVLVGLESDGDAEALGVLAKQLAMHIAAARPLAVDTAGLSAEGVAREREVLTAEAQTSGKPPEVVERMVEGRLRKYFETVALLSQVFVIDGETRIEAVLANASKELGHEIHVSGFVCLELGEGVDKVEEDFVAEVNAAAKAG